MEERDVGVFYVPGFVCVCVCMCVQTDGKTDTLYRSVSRCQKGKASERKTLLDNAQHIERQYCYYRFFFCFFFVADLDQTSPHRSGLGFVQIDVHSVNSIPLILSIHSFSLSVHLIRHWRHGPIPACIGQKERKHPGHVNPSKTCHILDI